MYCLSITNWKKFFLLKEILKIPHSELCSTVYYEPSRLPKKILREGLLAKMEPKLFFYITCSSSSSAAAWLEYLYKGKGAGAPSTPGWVSKRRRKRRRKVTQFITAQHRERETREKRKGGLICIRSASPARTSHRRDSKTHLCELPASAFQLQRRSSGCPASSSIPARFHDMLLAGQE